MVYLFATFWKPNFIFSSQKINSLKVIYVVKNPTTFISKNQNLKPYNTVDHFKKALL